ncbi:MAG: hypothetical protein ACLPWF_08915 [Bryobacteraceae bacterium]
MTVPLEVDFWNMPPDVTIDAAAQNEARSLETDSPITSCRVTVTPWENSYAVQIVVLAGSCCALRGIPTGPACCGTPSARRM